ncbi:MAG: phosphoadenosine phosphosulfate reductase family protein [Aeriscardovia sp.]|nr:phosphoadenosine phosphosulfate reductase family protein [Aeriscardovia sp.]
MTENEFILEDRLGVIRDTINKYGEDNFYLSFSGGKDSTVVHHLLDMAVPNNKIPRVFSNTGIEYNAIVEFVRERERADKRFVIIQPKQNIKAMLEKVGYPFKSKEHSQKVSEYQAKHQIRPYLQKYINGEGRFACPQMLKYQFTEDFKLKVSHYCCYELKKKPFKAWTKENNKTIVITGMMRDEGGQRTQIDCIHIKNGKATKFHPLAKVTHEWEQWFIEKNGIELCKLYYPPYNFERTGCKGCPFNPLLNADLATMDACGMGNERKQCEYIWQPVYAEYRRLGYRLKSEEQTKLF